MELTNEFRVGVPREEAWALFTDVARIAPCMPGAELQEVEGDDYHGTVRVKVGPITAQYKGVARFVEKDEEQYRVVVLAEGRETRGQGNASATVTAVLTEEGDGTAVSVVTDLKISGRVAQFGRGVISDVSAKLLDQFVDCLEAKLQRGSEEAPETGGGVGEDVESTVPVAPVDLLGVAGASILKRLGMLVVAVVTLTWLRSKLRRRKDKTADPRS